MPLIDNANINKIRVTEQAGDPSTPATTFGYLYAKTDGLYFMGDDGVAIGPLTGVGLDDTFNLTATNAPGVNDDIDGGYVPGSIWVNLTLDQAYICLDNTDGAAVWIEITDPVAGSADPQLSNLSSVAVNTDIISDSNETDSLGSTALKWLNVFQVFSVFDEQASPVSTPASGDVVLYAKNDGLLYSKDDVGTETLVSGGVAGGGADTALSNLASVAVNTDITSDTDSTDSLGTTAIKWLAGFFDKLVFGEGAAPSTPASGDVVLYAKTDGLLYSMDDLGTETLVSSGAGGGGATTALDNLAAVAINTSLISDTDSTDSLGSTLIKWLNAFLDILTFGEAAAPGTPASGDVILYAKTDGLLYSKDDLGTETLVSGGDVATRANTALSNLASVAVNTDIISDTDGTDSLGSSLIKWLTAFVDKTIFGEAAAPATPATGDVALYAKTDGLLYSKDDAGVETLVSGGSDMIAETLIDAKGDLIAGSAADTAARLAVGSNGQHLVADSGETTGIKWKTDRVSLNFVIDGGGSAIATGVKGYIQIPFACTINAVRLLADQTGSIVVDIWKDVYANYPPTDADTITGANEPTISSGTKDEDTTLTSWTTSIAAGDILGFNVDSATTVERVTLVLELDKGA